MKILELPERAQQLIGEGVIHLAAVDQLRAIGTVAPGAARRRDRLPRRRQRVGRRAAHARARLGARRRAHATPATARCSPPTCTRASAHEIAELRLGKKTEQLYAQAEKLHKQLDRYAYGPPQVRFTDDGRRPGARRRRADRVRARPADHRRPPALPRARQGRDQAHPRRARGQGRRGRQGEEDRARRARRRPTRSPSAKRERDAQLRELADQAHGANLDLGARARSTTSPPSTRATSTSRGSSSTRCSAPTTTARPTRRPGERIARIAAGGVRLVVDELRTDVTKTRKDGSRGRLRDRLRRPPRPAGRARVAVEVHRRRQDRRRALRPRAGRDRRRAARHAGSSCPSSQRMPATRWSSHKDIAAKALKKLAGPHVPASLTQARAGRQARPRRLRQGRDRGARAAPRRAPGRRDRARRRARSTTSSTRTSPTPRSRSARCAGRPATRGWHALAGVRVAGDRPAHRARTTRPKGDRRWPVASTAARSPTPSATRAAKPTASASSRPRAPCSPPTAGSAGSACAPPTASRATASATSG